MSDTIFITEPKVYLIAGTATMRGMRDFTDDNAISWRPNIANEPAEVLAEFAGRICYMSFDNPRPGGNEAYIKHILEVGHGSVLEHASFSLLFTGVSRSLTHETVRHRAGFGYSQLSQRYVDESDCAFVVPPELIKEVMAARELIARFGGPPHPKAIDVLKYLNEHAGLDVAPELTPEQGAGLRWLMTIERSQADYAYLTDYIGTTLSHIENKTDRRKKAREAARSVLPNATETKIVVTGNARSWRHWLHMRGSEHADAEIRRLAGHVLPILKECAPNIFSDCTIDALGVVTVQHQA